MTFTHSVRSKKKKKETCTSNSNVHSSLNTFISGKIILNIHTAALTVIIKYINTFVTAAVVKQSVVFLQSVNAECGSHST